MVTPAPQNHGHNLPDFDLELRAIDIRAIDIGFVGDYLVVELLGRRRQASFQFNHLGKLEVYEGNDPQRLTTLVLPHYLHTRFDEVQLQRIGSKELPDSSANDNEPVETFLCLILRSGPVEIVIGAEWYGTTGVFATVDSRLSGQVTPLWCSRSAQV